MALTLLLRKIKTIVVKTFRKLKTEKYYFQLIPYYYVELLDLTISIRKYWKFPMKHLARWIYIYSFQWGFALMNINRLSLSFILFEASKMHGNRVTVRNSTNFDREFFLSQRTLNTKRTNIVSFSLLVRIKLIAQTCNLTLKFVRLSVKYAEPWNREVKRNTEQCRDRKKEK